MDSLKEIQEQLAANDIAPEKLFAHAGHGSDENRNNAAGSGTVKQ